MEAETWARLIEAETWARHTKTELIKIVIQNNLHTQVPEWGISNTEEFLSRDDYKSEPIAKATKNRLALMLIDAGVVRATKRKSEPTNTGDQPAIRKRKIVGEKIVGEKIVGEKIVGEKLSRARKLESLVVHQKEQMVEPLLLKLKPCLVDGNYQIDDIVINSNNIAIGTNQNGILVKLTGSDVDRCIGERILFDNLRLGNY